jgi:hypothetical protein
MNAPSTCECIARAGCVPPTTATTTTTTTTTTTATTTQTTAIATMQTTLAVPDTKMPPISSGGEDDTLPLSTTATSKTTSTMPISTTRAIVTGSRSRATTASPQPTPIRSSTSAVSHALDFQQSGVSASALIGSTTLAASTELPDTLQASPTDAALIGGIVGGIAACLLLTALIALIILRKRRRNPPKHDAHITDGHAQMMQMQTQMPDTISTATTSEADADFGSLAALSIQPRTYDIVPIKRDVYNTGNIYM